MASAEYETSSWGYKIKLHGTNAGIRIDGDGTVTAQKKSDDITVEDDNAGFAAFVDELKAQYDLFTWARRYYQIKPGENVTIMGEWAGPGIQKLVAVSQIPEKTFFPFATFHKTETDHTVYWDDAKWNRSMGALGAVHRVMPIHRCGFANVNLRDRKESQIFLDAINTLVERIEACDPPILAMYGIEGVGEGLVFYPGADTGICSKSAFEALGFKVKGEKHAVSKAGKPARMKSDIPESAYVFADMHCTEVRLEQGVGEVGGCIPENTGKFIGWICKDIAVECAQEIEESGMDWKGQLSGVIATKARHWFLEKA